MTEETAGESKASSDAGDGFGRHSLTWRFVAWILGSVGVVFLVTVLYSDRLARELILAAAEAEARTLASAYAKDLRNGLRAIESRTELLAVVLGRTRVAPDELDSLLRAFVERSETIHGAAAAFTPRAFHPELEYFGPRHFLRRGAVSRVDLASEAHRYWERDWYKAVVTSAGPRWSDPYEEPGGEGRPIVTYSAPIFHGSDKSGGLRGVVASDVSLDWLHERMKTLQIGETGFGAIVSREGFIISHPDETLPRGIELTEESLSQSTPEVRALVERMRRGESGFEKMLNPYLGKEARTAFEPVGHANWSIVVVYPEHELLEDATRVATAQKVVLAAGGVMLVVIVFFLSRQLTGPIKGLASAASRLATGDLDTELPTSSARDEVGGLTRSFRHMRDSLKTYVRELTEATAARERLLSELKLAHKIQMDMLPRDNPAEEGSGFELAATLVPAREVGGDLFYHFVEDGRVAFLVGDVSGKGIAAALFMARTKTLFETIARDAENVGEALARVNESLCRDNDAGMFVTVFAGVYEPSTGKLRCASGGHDAPAIVPGSGAPVTMLDVSGGPLLGLLDGAEFPNVEIDLAPGDTIVVTTDGVSEASNAAGHFFGEEGLVRALGPAGGMPALDVTTRLLEAVRSHVGDAPQSDDITILTLRVGP